MEDLDIKLLQQAYQSFNGRDADGVIALMTNDVRWPNGWEGGFVNGKEEVKKYWTRQWQQLNPIVKPVGFEKMDDGSIRVKVHQLVRTLTGEVVFDGLVTHTYQFKNGLIEKMDIS